MTVFSVAEAKNKLPGLIDRAVAGEEVVITRHGRPVAELRPVTRHLKARRLAMRRFGANAMRASRSRVSSVELLRLVYEEEN